MFQYISETREQSKIHDAQGRCVEILQKALCRLFLDRHLKFEGYNPRI